MSILQSRVLSWKGEPCFCLPLGLSKLKWFWNLQIQDLERVLESITENETKAQSLRSWLEAQSDRLRSLRTPASVISAQNTIDDCKVKHCLCDIIVKVIFSTLR